MDEITGMLQKIRTLAVQARNGTNTLDDRKALSAEATALTQEITRIAKQTKFGGSLILDGAGTNSIMTKGKDTAGQDSNNVGKLTLQVGANKGDTIDFQVNAMKFSQIASAAGVTADNLKAFFTGAAAGGKISFTKVESVDKLLENIDKMIGAVDGSRAGLGAIQNRLESSIRNQANVSANQADARSRIRDADFAEESANLSQQSIIQQAATSMLMQANTRPQLGLSLLG